MIRRAIPEDIFRLAEMGQAFFDEAGIAERLAAGDGARLEFDLESFARTVAALIEHGILLVAEKGGTVVGMAAAGASPAWWNRKVLTAQELFWYVEPGHRKGIGAKLMSALEEAVGSLGVTLFSMSAEEGLRSTALNRLYRQRGYFPTETLFWKQIGSSAQ
ncbi:GNAT family N-acetyltransferase [uncultured Bradyrhizobium sp.]|uniref:GNAT family N-acetyltransferase n=1 Tax=uncultured Bradyrhizobium sp. TaxID=199684 RepID=UPI00262AE761|nr:GNAT family N-acetyltransferase [uncultured Bradyrhizobium sp.]